MPPISSLEPGTPTHEPETPPTPADAAPSSDPNAPVTFVPHDASGAIRQPQVRIRTNRYGELDEHELIHLLDSIEDERARARFRESVYISCFIWLLIAWLGFYGPKYLWHAPKVVDPMAVLREREMTQLNFSPASPHISPPPAAPPPKLDNDTLERLRAMTRARAPEPLPNAPKPAPTPLPPTSTVPPIPPPTAPTPNVRTPPPVVAEAPAPQPSTRPSFNTNPGTAGDAIRNAINGAAHDRGGGSYSDRGGPSNPLKMGGAEILSDTQGVNFDPYLQRILSDIKRNWLPLIPEEARPPLSKQGETLVRFTIGPNGEIQHMALDGSTHDDAINRSAWGAITSEGQFPPLPSQFHGPNLELRIHFLANKEIE